MYISKIFKVIYSPQKTFKEIVSEPKYIAPLLIFLLVIAVNVVSAYVIFSREYYEQVLPNGTKLDEWTQNSTFWTTTQNFSKTENNDSITGTYYGNASIQFTAQQNSSALIMSLINNIGTINCSTPDGYDLVSFRIKYLTPATPPSNVTVQMFSGNSTSNGFSTDITDDFSNTTSDTWNNLTIPIGSAASWAQIGQNANWSQITGLQYQFMWAQPANITLRIDGLFFRGPYESLITSTGSLSALSYGIPFPAIQFLLTWVILAGVAYILIRAFKGTVVWKPMLICAGFAMVAALIGAIISFIGYATLPNLYYPFEVFGGVAGEGTALFNSIASNASLATNIGLIAEIIIWVWTAGLMSVAARTITGFSWPKSVIIGALAFAIAAVIVNFLVA